MQDAAPDVRSLAQLDRRDQSGIAADKYSVFDDRLVFMHAVVVAGDGAGTDVHAFANFGVAEIGEVVGFRSLAQANLLGLHKIADVRAFADVASRAQMRIRAEDRAVCDARIVEHAAGADENAVADLANSG